MCTVAYVCHRAGWLADSLADSAAVSSKWPNGLRNQDSGGSPLLVIACAEMPSGSEPRDHTRRLWCALPDEAPPAVVKIASPVWRSASSCIDPHSGKADVGFGSFYDHFSTKSELFEAAVADVLEELGELSTGSAWTSRTSPRPSPSRSG